MPTSGHNGFTLLETLVALFLLVVVTGSIASLVVRAFSANQESISRMTAAMLAQEGIEIVRNIRDTNYVEERYGGSSPEWDTGIDEGGPFGIDYRTEGIPDSDCTGDGYLRQQGGENRFRCHTGSTRWQRQIWIDKMTPEGTSTQDMMQVRVKVSWEEGGETRTVEASDLLYNWLRQQ